VHFAHFPFIGYIFKRGLTSIRSRKIKTDSGIYLIDKNDSLALLKNGDYGHLEKLFFSKVVNSGETVLDIGANIGYFSTFFSKLTGQNGRVYCFEPSPENYTLLIKNIEINKAKNARAYQIAAGDCNSTLKLYLNEENSGDNRFFSDEDAYKSVEVPVQKLDDLQEIVNTEVNFIKIDIQGNELSALKGMEEILMRNNNIKIFCEYWPYGLISNNTNPKDLYDYIKSLGFIIYDFKEGLGLKKINSFKDLNLIDFESKAFTDIFCSRTEI